jgi:hypothetical protein
MIVSPSLLFYAPLRFRSNFVFVIRMKNLYYNFFFQITILSVFFSTNVREKTPLALTV